MGAGYGVCLQEANGWCMRTARLIKVFDFLEDQRSLISIGTGARLNPEEHCLQLKETSLGLYETGIVRICSTQLFNPTTSQGWVTVEPIFSVGKDLDGIVRTWIGYRLGNSGPNSYYWNGTSWIVTATLWNTLEEISANISSFQFPDGVRLIVGMSTQLNTVTPKIRGYKICWLCAGDQMEELLLRTLVPTLRSGLKPIAEFVTVMETADDEVILDGIQTPYSIYGIDCAFDETSDPDHEKDLYSSWNPGTKKVTLTETVSAGHRVRVRFIYSPEIAITTSQDYSEMAEYPAVVLDSIGLVNAFTRAETESIVNRGDGTGIELSPPVQGDFDVQIVTIADKLVDHIRLATEIQRLIGTIRTVHCDGLDETWPITVQEKYASQLSAGKEELHRGMCQVRLHNVRLYLSGDRDLYAVQRMHLQGMMDSLIEPPLEGD